MFFARREKAVEGKCIFTHVGVNQQGNFGVEFAGGDDFLVPHKSGTSIAEVRAAVENTGVDVSSATTRGSGADAKYDIRTPKLNDEQRTAVKTALVDSAKVTPEEISNSEVSSSWGSAVTKQAIIGLIVFLIVGLSAPPGACPFLPGGTGGSGSDGTASRPIPSGKETRLNVPNAGGGTRTRMTEVTRF